MSPLTSGNSSSRKKAKADLTQESFDRLLGWLDGDRDRAGRKYEAIRFRLIRIFACRGCGVPEELADETINRVALKSGRIAESYVGDPVSYFCGVADKVYLEHIRKRPVIQLPLPSATPEENEIRCQCLEQCMGALSAENRELILAYYDDDQQQKMALRKELGERLGIGPNAMYIRAHRIREKLRGCVRECVRRRTIQGEPGDDNVNLQFAPGKVRKATP
jgi:DNA-directed RNA polymerase specialized sigma24 family protein